MADMTWQDIANTALQIGRGVVDFQYQKKAMRDAQKQAKYAARAQFQGGSGYMPTIGMGYAATPMPSGQQLPIQNAGFDWGPLVQNPLANALGLGDPMQGVISGGSSTASQGCFRTSTPGAPRVTPCREIMATGPDGKMYSWVYRGRPVLYSGDLATCKRVAKILRRSGRKAGQRFR